MTRMFRQLEHLPAVPRILIKGLLGTLAIAVMAVLSFGLIWLMVHAWPVAAALGVICLVVYLGMIIDLMSHNG